MTDTLADLQSDRQALRVKVLDTRICDFCGRQFNIIRKEVRMKKRFCDLLCNTGYAQLKRRKKHPVKSCTKCGEMFEPLNNRQRFCTDICRKQYRPEVTK